MYACKYYTGCIDSVFNNTCIEDLKIRVPMVACKHHSTTVLLTHKESITRITLQPHPGSTIEHEGQQHIAMTNYMSTCLA
jgi:hypothetical protein